MDNPFMRAALYQAEQAAENGEVPVGAVVVRQGQVISAAHNLCETRKNSLCHAEMLAISHACEILNCHRLDDCDLYVTLEPCAMCCGAIAHAQLRRLYFGAYDPKGGCVVSNLHCLDSSAMMHKTEYYCGLMEDACGAVLSAFFEKVRKSSRSEMHNRS